MQYILQTIYGHESLELKRMSSPGWRLVSRSKLLCPPSAPTLRSAMRFQKKDELKRGPRLAPGWVVEDAADDK